MNHFELKNGELHCEDVPLRAIAEAVGTPVYVYSRATLERHADAFKAGVAPAGDVHVAFAVKANPNLAVLNVLARRGCGADVVSEGEMVRALAAGVPPADIVFSGVGKTKREMVAALDAGIGQFNIESEVEGEELSTIAAARGERAVCTLRINPDVDARTHAKISTGKSENKFGVPISDAEAIYGRLAALPGLMLRGVAIHIGSQLLTLDPLEEAFDKVGVLVHDLRDAGHQVSHVDLGGGLGVRYKSEDDPRWPDEYGAMVARITGNWGCTLMFEPGRVIAANAGVLLTEVIRVKPGVICPFVIVDAAMNDLARPALYDAWHDFEAVIPSGQRMQANVVGPVCETGDTFAMDRDIDVVQAGDLAIFRSAGAYGATMASFYNSRAMVPEVMVSGDRWAVVADRIPAAATVAAERVPDFLQD
jgi:diaminopimelate decarboxylase